MKFRVFLVVSILIFITGCGQKIHTLKYYSEHSDEANKVIVKCQTIDRTDKDAVLNCQNAYAAEFAKGLSQRPNL